jgi:hypothetical protein
VNKKSSITFLLNKISKNRHIFISGIAILLVAIFISSNIALSHHDTLHRVESHNISWKAQIDNFVICQSKENKKHDFSDENCSILNISKLKKYALLDCLYFLILIIVAKITYPHFKFFIKNSDKEYYLSRAPPYFL